jgi:enoyl-CoA hydratase/carnithine racemase
MADLRSILRVRATSWICGRIPSHSILFRHFTPPIGQQGEFKQVPPETLWHRAFETIEFGRVPVVAVLHSAVTGARLELAAAAVCGSRNANRNSNAAQVVWIPGSGLRPAPE